jgi:hypothetical protein
MVVCYPGVFHFLPIVNNVIMGDNVGDWMSIESGAPQGSVLGPLFFIIYINDLIKSITIPIKVYTDDIKQILGYNDSSECIDLQNTLDIIHMWTNKFLFILILRNVKYCISVQRNIKTIN